MSVLEAHPHAAAVLGAALRDPPVARLPVPRPGRLGQARGGARVRRRAARRATRRTRVEREGARAGRRRTRTSRGSRRAARTSCCAATSTSRWSPPPATRRSRRAGACSCSSAPTRWTTRPPTRCSRRSRSRPRYVVLILLTDKPDPGAADDHLALPGRALRPAARRRGSRSGSSRSGVAPIAARACARLSLGDGERALALALGEGPALRARAEAFARARAARRAPAERSRGARLLDAARTAGGARRGASSSAALAEELEYLPKKEHRRKRDRVHRARPPRRARRAETGALDHALQLAGLWYRDLACLAADAEELVLTTRPARGAARRRRDRRLPARCQRGARAGRGHARAAAAQRQLRPRAPGARLPARAQLGGLPVTA